jgi:hypothetical protein
VDVTVTIPGGSSTTNDMGRYTYRVEIIFCTGLDQ